MAREPLSQDDLDAEAAVRAAMDARLTKLDFAAEFEAAGESYSELDEDGRVVIRFPAAKSVAPPP